MKKIKFIPIVVLFCNISFAQEVMQIDTLALSTIDGTIDQMLHIINGEKKKTRNWNAFKSLFLPTANFTVVYNDKSSPRELETATVDDMIEYMKDDYYDSGYTETNLNRKIDSYNGIAQVLEVVEHEEPDGKKILGLNSYQLVHKKQRWWIANIIWATEANGIKIPEHFFKN